MSELKPDAEVEPLYTTPPADDSHDDSANSAKRPLRLTWQQNQRDGQQHEEWTAPCGCAYHPEPEPHVHPCSLHRTTGDSHDKAVRLLKRASFLMQTGGGTAGRDEEEMACIGEIESYLANQPKGEK